MRSVLLVVVLGLAACSSSPLAPPEPLAPPVDAPPTPICALADTAPSAEALFVLEPTRWVPLASRVLGCSPEAVADLQLGSPQRAPATTVDTYRRQIANREQVLLIAYDSTGVVGVSVGEDVPERLTETVFDLRSVQTQEASGGEAIPSPAGTLVFPATPVRPYGVRLVSAPPRLVLSVIRE